MRRALLGVVLGAGLLMGCPPPQMPGPREVSPEGPIGDRRLAFAASVELMNRGQYAQAAPRFRSLLESYPALEDYHLYYLGLALARTQDAEAARPILRRLLASHPQSVWLHRAALELGNVDLQTDQLDSAREAYHTAAEAHDHLTALDGEFGRARTDVAAGRLAAAAEELQGLRREAPGELVGIRARSELIQLRAAHPELAPTGLARIDELRVLLAERDFASAEPLARELVADSTRDDRVELLHLHAQALLGLGRVDDGIGALRAALAAESGAAATATLFHIASTLWNRDRDEQALDAFQDLRRRYPRSAKANEALYATGRIHEQAGRSREAISAYRELAQVAPHDQLAREGRWRIGWIYYRRADWKAAERSFAVLASGCEISACADALYWQARAMEHSGRGPAAREVYQRIAVGAPTSYYAMWADDRLGIGRTVPGTLTPVSIDTALPDGGYHSDRALELKQAGLLGLARRELAAHERDHQDDAAELRRLIDFYPTVDGHGAALRLARRLGPKAHLSRPKYDRVMYPLGFWPIINRTAAPAGVDPVLVAALIRQESLYDPDARSSADAWGLMQLLPRTAERVAGAAVSADDLRDPQRNIELGTGYLATLLAMFHGDPLKALAAYNGGESAVKKWERRFPGTERDEFVESISYRETRDYVKKVMRGYREYVRLYGKTNPDLESGESCAGNQSQRASASTLPPSTKHGLLSVVSKLPVSPGSSSEGTTSTSSF